MVDPAVATLVSVGLVSLLSFVGLLTLSLKILQHHGVMFSLVALAAGTLLGDAFFHLLPESLEIWGSFDASLAVLVLAGFLVFYVLEAALRLGHAHGEVAHLPHPTGAGPIKPFGVLNLVGDALHNFLDGTIIAASFLVDFKTGVATTIAVAIHEIPQEFGDFGVLLRAGFRPFKAAMFNLVSAVFAVGGAVLILVLPFDPETLERFALPIVAGGFLYIAAADLIPEIHHHTRPAFVPLVLLLLVVGLGIMFGITFLE